MKTQKYFKAYAKGRKLSNTIWSLKDSEGREVSDFRGLASMGYSHFESLFKALREDSLPKVVQITLLLPRFMEEDNYGDLMVPISEEELKSVIHKFQKDKSPGPDG